MAWRDAISDSVFLTLLSRGCGFCGRASKGALFAPVSNHDVTETGGGDAAPNTWREVGNSFHFLCYFWLLIQCLTSSPLQGAAVGVILGEDPVPYMSGRRKARSWLRCSCGLYTEQGLVALQIAPLAPRSQQRR